jgi:hypothetical protein
MIATRNFSDYSEGGLGLRTRTFQISASAMAADCQIVNEKWKGPTTYVLRNGFAPVTITGGRTNEVLLHATKSGISIRSLLISTGKSPRLGTAFFSFIVLNINWGRETPRYWG